MGLMGAGLKASGIAPVARDNFSARYDLDRLRGTFSCPDLQSDYEIRLVHLKR